MSGELVLLENSVELLEVLNRTRKKHGLGALSILALEDAAKQAQNYLLGDRRTTRIATTLRLVTTSMILLKLTEPDWWVSEMVPTLFEAVTQLEAEEGVSNSRVGQQRIRRLREDKGPDLESEFALCCLIALHLPEQVQD